MSSLRFGRNMSIIMSSTSRDRPKSAQYLRLKNSKRTSKCQSIFYSTRKFFWKVSQCRKKLKGDTLKNFFQKKSRNAEKKTEKGDLLVSSDIVYYAGNLFGSVPWTNRGNLKFCRTILVTSGESKKMKKKNTDEKP